MLVIIIALKFQWLLLQTYTHTCLHACIRIRMCVFCVCRRSQMSRGVTWVCSSLSRHSHTVKWDTTLTNSINGYIWRMAIREAVLWDSSVVYLTLEKHWPTGNINNQRWYIASGLWPVGYKGLPNFYLILESRILGLLFSGWVKHRVKSIKMIQDKIVADNSKPCYYYFTSKMNLVTDI